MKNIIEALKLIAICAVIGATDSDIGYDITCIGPR